MQALAPVAIFPLGVDRLQDAARHVAEIASLDAQIQQYGEFESHDQFMSRIKSKHPRKYGFWPLLSEGS